MDLNKIYCGDCLDLMKEIPNKSIDLLLTDPPYGCNKAEGDNSFPKSWFGEAVRVSKTQAIITGSYGIKDTIPLLGDSFIDCISLWNKNGMTRSPLGYGNWLAVVISGDKPRQGPNHLNFSVSGEMPNHPSPKPLEAITKLVERLSEPDQIILDPFAGSCTTAVACIKTGRNFICIEKEPEYCKIGKKRISALPNTRLTDTFYHKGGGEGMKEGTKLSIMFLFGYYLGIFVTVVVMLK